MVFMVRITKKRADRSSEYSDKIFAAVNYGLLSLIFLLVLYPLLFVLSASFSDPEFVNTGQVYIWPRGFNIEGYTTVFSYSAVYIGYRNSFLYTLFGTLLNIALTMTAAYALSRKDMYGRGLLTLIMAFTMWFSGGLIPTFMLVNSLGLVNTPYVMVILGAISIWNMIIARTFIQSSIPTELQEAARIDGCNDFRIFFTIILPLSVPVIAVLTLFYAARHWNSYFNALIYLNDLNLRPLQIVLREILIQNQTLEQIDIDEAIDIARRARLAQTMKYSLIMIASIPMLMLYPFAQRFFIKGIMVGSIKG